MCPRSPPPQTIIHPSKKCQRLQDMVPEVLDEGDDLAETEDSEGQHVLAGLHGLEPNETETGPGRQFSKTLSMFLNSKTLVMRVCPFILCMTNMSLFQLLTTLTAEVKQMWDKYDFFLFKSSLRTFTSPSPRFPIPFLSI